MQACSTLQIGCGEGLTVEAHRRLAPRDAVPRSTHDLFMRHLPLIESIIRRVARRSRLSTEDEEEFGAMVRLRLLEKNGHILRAIRDHHRVAGFLSVVIGRLCLDYRVSQWGKWRPSVRARRQGPAAAHLEQLLVRDGLSWDEVCAQMRCAGYALPPNAEELQTSAATRVRRRVVQAPTLESTAIASDPSPDLLLLHRETARVVGVLGEIVGSLSADDQQLLKQRFLHRLTVTEIADEHGWDRRHLYRRLAHLLRQLRRSLEARGVSRNDVTWGATLPVLAGWSEPMSLGDVFTA